MDGNVDGGLLEVTFEGVIGWLQLTSAAVTTFPRLFLCVKGELLAEVKSFRFDLALVHSRVGKGLPGFAIMLPRLPAGDGPVELELRTATGSLVGAPLAVRNRKALYRALRIAASEGFVDRLDKGAVLGWAWDSSNAADPVMVELFDGDLLLTRGLADQFREDLARAGKRGGFCGFRIDLPASLLDGANHVIHVRVAGLPSDLPNAPLVFGPKNDSPVPADLWPLLEEVARLRTQVESILNPHGCVQSEIMQVLADRVAAFATIERTLIDRRLAALEAKMAGRPPRRARKRFAGQNDAPGQGVRPDRR